jgi:hypothetical protein
MMIIDPVTLGDVACTRASVKYVYDRTGTLVQVPANTLAVTYDPSDLTKAPYALVEAAATNQLWYSAQFDNAAWSPEGSSVSPNMQVAPDGTTTADKLVESASTGVHRTHQGSASFSAGTNVVFSIYLKAGERTSFIVELFAGGANTDIASPQFDLVAGTITSGIGAIESAGNGWYRCSAFGIVPAGATSVAPYIHLYAASSAVYAGDGTSGAYMWGSQLEAGTVATSYIPTTSAPGTRAADVIASGAGLVYSNVPITETAYSGTATYALNAIVYDPATYLMYQSLIATNTGKALTDTTSWVPTNTSVNRRQMFDQYNNTQTSNAEEIIVVLSPQAIAQGVYIGNADASDVRISCYDQTEGLVYQETQNLLISDSGSSFYNWCFKRIRKKSYAVSVQLPPYRSGLVTIALKKPGGTPKCGMCVLGLLVDIGLAQYGLSREIKDYSTVNFNFDGTSNVVKRNFAKIMDVDVIIDNDMIDGVIESLEGYRQKPVAWIGTAAYGSACLYGTYTSFKNVIQYPTQSAMSLQIQGTV